VPLSDAISTSSTSLTTDLLAASIPRPCQSTPPAPMHVTSVPTPPSAKPSWTSIFPYTFPSSNGPTYVQNVGKNSPINTTCATTNAYTTLAESRSSNVNTVISGQIDNRIWSATPSSCMPAQAWMHRSPATCQNQSPGGLLSRFLKHVHPSHTLRTRTFNLAVG
jgi:hypothetical protein